MKYDIEKLKEFNNKLNEDPLLDIDAQGKPRYIKDRAVGGGKKAKYIVHTRRDHLLNDLFPYHQFNIINEHILTKSRMFRQSDGTYKPREVSEYIVSVELRVLHPVFNEFMSFPGIGSASDNGMNIMQSVAPSALEFARSNATKKIGRIFGAYLNKDDDEVFVDISLDDKIAALKTILSGTFDSLNALENAVQADNNDILADSTELTELYNKSREKIKEKLKYKAEYEEFMSEKMPELSKEVAAITDISELEIKFKSLRTRDQNWAKKIFSEKKKQLNTAK